MSRRGGVSRREVLKRAGVAGTAILALPDLGRVLPGTTDVVAQTRPRSGRARMELPMSSRKRAR